MRYGELAEWTSEGSPKRVFTLSSTDADSTVLTNAHT